MNIQLTGIIRQINSSEIKGTFEKRTLHLAEEKDSYPSVWCLEAQQAFCNVLDKYKVGDKVECSVDVVGREWEKDGVTKCFNNLKVWKINKVGEKNYAITDAEVIEDDGSSLPF